MKEVWIVVTNKKYIPYKDQYQVFDNDKSALEAAKKLGYLNQFGIPIIKEVGMMNFSSGGENNEFIGLMKVVVQS